MFGIHKIQVNIILKPMVQTKNLFCIEKKIVTITQLNIQQ